MKLTEQNVLTQEAMLAYVAGTLSVEEKQQFEQLLQNDPFAQDALEGLQNAPQVTVTAAIESINKKVRERTGLQQKNTIQLHWTTYAWAAVLVGLLVGVGVVMVNMLGKGDGQIAMDQTPQEKTEEVLFEQNQTEQQLVSANQTPVVDSSAISYREAYTSVEGANKANGAVSTRSSEEQKPAITSTSEIADAVKKESSPATKTITASGGAVAPIVTVSPAAVNGAEVLSTKNTEQAKGKSGDLGKAEDRKETAASETKADTKATAKQTQPQADNVSLRVTEPTTQKVVRGSVIESEETDKKRVVTMDGAMKNFNSGNYKDAGQDFDALLQQQPQNADALYFGGISDYINGNTKKSEKNFDKLLKDGGKFQEGSKWYKANILLRRGKKEEAKKLLDELAGSGGSYKERAVKKKAELEF